MKHLLLLSVILFYCSVAFNQIEDLPQSRSYLDVATLVPGVVPDEPDKVECDVLFKIDSPDDIKAFQSTLRVRNNTQMSDLEELPFEVTPSDLNESFKVSLSIDLQYDTGDNLELYLYTKGDYFGESNHILLDTETGDNTPKSQLRIGMDDNIDSESEDREEATVLPGDVYTYTVDIKETGGADVNNVQVILDLDDKTMLDPNSIQITPFGLPDKLDVFQDISTVFSSDVLLQNDFPGTGSQLQIIITPNLNTEQGGIIDVIEDGFIRYTPPPGLMEPDLFSYSIETVEGVADLTETTVNLNFVPLPIPVWVIDNTAPGPEFNGTFSEPFQTIDQFNAIQGIDAQPGDIIFINASNDPYVGNFTLLKDQQLIGEGSGLQIGDVFLVPPGEPPVISNPGGSIVNLGQDNIIQGFDFTNAPDPPIFGDNFGDLIIRDVSINNSDGPAFTLKGGTVDAFFDAIASGGGENGIILETVSGNIEFNGPVFLDNHVKSAISMEYNESLNVFFNSDLTVENIETQLYSGEPAFHVYENELLSIITNDLNLQSQSTGIEVKNNTTSTFMFGRFSITTFNEPAFNLFDPGTITATNEENNVKTTDAPVLDFNNINSESNFVFDNVESINSPDAGFKLNDFSGILTINHGNIEYAEGPAVSIKGGVPTLSYFGNIKNNAGRLLDITDATVNDTYFQKGFLEDDGGDGINIGNVDLGNMVIDSKLTLVNCPTAPFTVSSSTGSLSVSNLGIDNPGGSAVSVIGGTVSLDIGGDDIVQPNSFPFLKVDNHSEGEINMNNENGSATNGTGFQFNNAHGTYSVGGATSLNGGDAGIDILGGSTGTFTFSDVNITSSSSGPAINIIGGTSSVNITGTNLLQGNNFPLIKIEDHADGTIDFNFSNGSATNGTGIQINNAGGIYNFGGTITLNGGDAGIDILSSSGTFTFSNTDIIDPIGANINFSEGTGNFTISGTYLTQSNNSPLINIENHNTGTFGINNTDIIATNGTGIQVDNGGGIYNIKGTVTLNGGDAGIDILNSTGAFNFDHTDILNPSGTNINIDGGTADINLSGGYLVKDKLWFFTSYNHSEGEVNINYTNGSITGSSGALFDQSHGTYNIDGAIEMLEEAGWVINESDGTFMVGEGVTVNTNTTDVLNVSGGAPDINYFGPLSNDGGHLLNIENVTGGTINISNSSIQNNNGLGVNIKDCGCEIIFGSCNLQNPTEYGIIVNGGTGINTFNNLTINNPGLGGIKAVDNTGTLTITNSTITANEAPPFFIQDAGTVSILGSNTFNATNVTGFYGNNFTPGPGGINFNSFNVSGPDGQGGIFNDCQGGGPISINGGTIENCTHEGLFFGDASNVTINNTTISNNSASGIYNYVSGGPGNTVTVSNSTISDNNSQGVLQFVEEDGFGIFHIENSVISGNSGNGFYQNVIENASDNSTITNSTFSGNTSNGIFQHVTGNGNGICHVSGNTLNDNYCGFTGLLSGTANISGTVTNNNIQNSENCGIQFYSNEATGGTLDVDVSNNIIGTLGNALSASQTRFAVFFGNDNLNSTNVVCDNNQIHEAFYPAFGFDTESNQGNMSASFTNNTCSANGFHSLGIWSNNPGIITCLQVKDNSFEQEIYINNISGEIRIEDYPNLSGNNGAPNLNIVGQTEAILDTEAFATCP